MASNFETGRGKERKHFTPFLIKIFTFVDFRVAQRTFEHAYVNIITTDKFDLQRNEDFIQHKFGWLFDGSVNQQYAGRVRVWGVGEGRRTGGVRDTARLND